ncbi:ATP-binding protein [Roseobacter sp. S98]|uniref:ATP-binding protein n=1 Tax=Roseobacter algicola (ex Choi et al. 2025) (nom. illeg.) TaxID=3092138 RepID=UPI0035C6F5DF
MTDLELTPIQVMEHLNDSKPLMTTQGPSSTIAPQAQSTNAPVWSEEALWLRGGLPESLYADSDEQSFNWRSDYLASLLNQDFDCWSIDASDRLPEVFQYVANTNGEQFDDANCAKTLSVKRDSVRKSTNLLERTGLLRRLPNWPAGSNQSNSSLPVFYVRDCGLLHAALGIRSMEDLRSHGAIGHSWESFAIEAIVNASSGNATPAFYRDKEKNEIDLVLRFSSDAIYAIEMKLNSDAKTKKGFAIGCDAVGATQRLVVHSGETDFTSDEGVPRLKLVSALKQLPQ